MSTSKVRKRKKAYTEARMAGKSREESAIIAGSDPNNRTINEQRDLLPALVVREGVKNAAVLEMTREQVMQGLMDAADMARLAAEPMAMVAAWKEIGRMCGYYAPELKKVTHEHLLGGEAKKALALLSDDDLYRFANAKLVKGETLGPVSPEPARTTDGETREEEKRDPSEETGETGKND